eukprot:s2106_g6.t1
MRPNAMMANRVRWLRPFFLGAAPPTESSWPSRPIAVYSRTTGPTQLRKGADQKLVCGSWAVAPTGNARHFSRHRSRQRFPRR